MAGVSTAQLELDNQALTRYLLAGYTLKECGALLGIAYPTVCRRARQPEFLAALKELNSERWKEVDHELKVQTGFLSQRIIEQSQVALDVLSELLNSADTDNRLRAKIAQDFLDRNAETSRATKATVVNEHKFINPLTLVAAHRAAQEMDAVSDNTKTLEADVA